MLGTLALWFLRGLFDSTLIFYFTLLTWMDDGILPHGRSAGLTVMGNTIAIAALFIVLARMAIETKTWNILLLFGYVFSVASFVGTLYVLINRFFFWLVFFYRHRDVGRRELDLEVMARDVWQCHASHCPRAVAMHSTDVRNLRRVRVLYSGTHILCLFLDF